MHAGSNAGDSLSIHDEQKFSTSNDDNDLSAVDNCAVAGGQKIIAKILNSVTAEVRELESTLHNQRKCTL